MISESPIGEWLDNPIFVKCVRARLRPMALGVGILIILVICGTIMAVGYEFGGFRSGWTFSMLLTFQVILLMIMGAAQVASTVGGTRTSGILDFHRISPLSSSELTFGFLLGAPVREYLLFGATLPFLLPCMVMGVPTIRGILQLAILLMASAWVMHSIALLGVLMANKATAARGAGALIVLLCILTIPALIATGRGLSQLDVDHELTLFGIPIPWLGVVLLDEAALLFFVLTACVRRMNTERAHPLSKPQAMACLLTVSVLVLGEMWDQVEVGIACLILIYTLVILSIVMTGAVTPDRAEYMKGLLRARKQGQSRTRWWDDLAWNRGFLAVACLLVMAWPSIAWSLAISPEPIPFGRFEATPLAIANGVLVVSYSGLAIQYFQLTFRKNGSTFAGLFFFLIWGLPVIVGVLVVSGSPFNEHIGRTVFAMSPIMGIAFAAAPVPDPHIAQIQFAAICPSLLFAFVFSGLAASARRRIDREVRLAFDGETDFGMAADKFLRI